LINASAYALFHPSFVEPEIIVPYAQASGAFDLIDGSGPRVRLAQDDLWVYMKRVDIRTQIAANSNAVNQLPGVSFTFGMIQMPTYLFQVRSEYNHHDQAAAAPWGASLPELYRLGMRQAHFQIARSALLYGMNPQNGEGLLNAPNATTTNLPPDSNGNQTVVTYDAGQMAFFFLSRILAMKTRTNQMGIGQKFTFVGPQRVLGQFEYPDIVQLVQFQREGAGSESTKGLIEDIMKRNGDAVAWQYDDTLIGKGSGGADAVIITMPSVQRPNRSGINTNEFAKFTPGNNVCATMYADMAAPREITAPLAGGATDVLSEWRLTPGWMVRTEAIDIISMVYQ
jgi:hypothetical protein